MVQPHTHNASYNFSVFWLYIKKKLTEGKGNDRHFCGLCSKSIPVLEFIPRKFRSDEKLFPRLDVILLTCYIVLFQMKSTRCTLLLSIFVSTSLRVSGNYVPIIRRTCCICVTLVFFTLYGWLSGLQTRQPPTKSEKYQCHTDTASSPDDGHIVARNT